MKTRRTWTADNGNGTFSNPLFYDEFSDPDLIRVGSDFYLTGTTMHTLPGLPVLHSKDLVNWRFLSYACERLDFGPAFRLEDGQQIYGQGIWAPSFRYHQGTFFIFTNVRSQPMQVFSATDPRGPWKQRAMLRAFHDPSVLFDDDGKVWVVWGYRDLRLAQLNADLTDIVPGTERVLFRQSDGMGEGAHFYKINGKYYITSAWFMGTMKMPCARANRPEGPYEVEVISYGEDLGLATGALHQGGIVDTPAGEWWGYSMMDLNSVGRLTSLSPITWKDGWPYFGLPGNLGRTPRTWVKPKTGGHVPPSAPFVRSDTFSEKTLSPIWQWNHTPEPTKWSLTERPGFLRLHSLPASDFWWARNTLTQRTIGPESTATVPLECDGLQPGDCAGLGLLNAPYAALGVRRDTSGLCLEQFDQHTNKTTRAPLPSRRIWLRVRCDFLTERAQFSYSTDGKRFTPLGAPFTMVYQLKTFQGVRFALFHFNTLGSAGGYADFAQVTIDEPRPRGLTRPIPYQQTITLATTPGNRAVILPGDTAPTRFLVMDRGQGRVSLQAEGHPRDSDTYQWIETLQGELTLLSLTTQRYLCLRPGQTSLAADHPGPQRHGDDGVRFTWTVAGR